MEKSVPGSGPQFYFVFRENELIAVSYTHLVLTVTQFIRNCFLTRAKMFFATKAKALLLSLIHI